MVFFPQFFTYLFTYQYKVQLMCYCILNYLIQVSVRKHFAHFSFSLSICTQISVLCALNLKNMLVIYFVQKCLKDTNSVIHYSLVIYRYACLTLKKRLNDAAFSSAWKWRILQDWNFLEMEDEMGTSCVYSTYQPGIGIGYWSIESHGSDCSHQVGHVIAIMLGNSNVERSIRTPVMLSLLMTAEGGALQPVGGSSGAGVRSAVLHQ